jgi:hypothetical protein
MFSLERMGVMRFWRSTIAFECIVYSLSGPSTGWRLSKDGMPIQPYSDAKLVCL